MNCRGTNRLLLAGRFLLIGLAATAAVAGEKGPVDWVDPTIDSAGSRWIFFSSACRPFGMVNLSPDTDVKGAWKSGYCHEKNAIRCFSHLHGWQLAAVPVLPTMGPMRGPEGSDAYRSRFRHETEIVRPGYHALTLDDHGIRVELTSTDRVGLHRWTFSKAGPAHVLFDLGMELGPTKMAGAAVRKVGDRELEGHVVNAPTVRRPKPCTVCFVARFDRPFEAFGGWNGKQVRNGAAQIKGSNSGAFVRFSPAAGDVIQLQVALSYVSTEQARLNLRSEADHWDFDRVKDESRRVWNDWLGKIEVHGGTPQQRTKFYTDLWHALLGRRLTSDVDGRYCDNTGPSPKVRRVPLSDDGTPRYHHYNSDAFWNTFWNVNVVWSLAYPEMMNQWVNFLVDVYKDGGLLPRGPSGHNYTFVMISAHSTPLVVGAYMKGIRDFDVVAAYDGMRKNHFPGGLMSKAGYEHRTCTGGGIEHYMEKGFIPDDRQGIGGWHADGCAQTLEYAYDDWCLAQMAKALGKEKDYRLFMKRAGNYRNVYDRETTFMRPRNTDGSWLSPFDPLGPKGFCEGTAWHYNWFAPHDLHGLARLMGGPAACTRKLNHAFEKAAAKHFVDPHVNYANQPAIAMGHVFNYTGAPWLAQKWIRRVKQDTFGGITPETGYRGDEDQGQAGGLGVLMAVGLFQMRGGAALEPIYEITSPVFDRVTIHLDKRYYPGGRFEIIARDNSPKNMYIQSATLDGRPLERPWFRHEDLVDGGSLVLQLGPEPNKSWGSRPEDAPPSMSRERTVQD